MGGEMHNVALKSDGTVWAWGWNALGQLGTGKHERRLCAGAGRADCRAAIDFSGEAGGGPILHAR